MHLHLLQPCVEPDEMKLPERCPHGQCGGRHFRRHQAVPKAVRDTGYHVVTAQRYQCLRCGRTFRVYPQGVTQARSSQRLIALAVMLYLLGLSYGAVSLALAALGVPLCKSRVYDRVQELAARVPGLRREGVFNDVRTPALGGDVTYVKCRGQWLPLGLTVDETNGLVLTVDRLSGEDTAVLKDWLTPIAEAVGAQLLVSDDADAFKQVAEDLGLEHQVCKSHVKRNTDTLIETLKAAIGATPADASLPAIGVSLAQALADLDQLGQLIRSRRPEEVTVLERLHDRYVQAPAPRPGEQATLAYRLRLLFLDRWNLWPRLTCYRTWQGPDGQTVDGTNNKAERAIGWWVKERYRTMRGYKRPQSALNVSRFLAWVGNHLNTGGAELAHLLA
jgi:transposase-like protein